MIFIIGTIARSTTCFVIAGKNTGQGPGLLGLYEVGTAALRGWSSVQVAAGAPAHSPAFGIAQLVSTAGARSRGQVTLVFVSPGQDQISRRTGRGPLLPQRLQQHPRRTAAGVAAAGGQDACSSSVTQAVAMRAR